MFGFLKRGNKEKEGATQVAEDQIPWGVPVKRKLSRKEEAAEAAEQEMVERKNQQRRDMYRIAGTEHIFNDLQGRRLAMRVEDNTGPKASPSHPPLFVAAFWGARELAHLKAEIENNTLRLLDYRTEGGYEGWGIPAELLRELEKLARSKAIVKINCPDLAEQKDWDNALFTQLGYQSGEGGLVKSL